MGVQAGRLDGFQAGWGGCSGISWLAASRRRSSSPARTAPSQPPTPHSRACGLAQQFFYSACISMAWCGVVSRRWRWLPPTCAAHGGRRQSHAMAAAVRAARQGGVEVAVQPASPLSRPWGVCGGVQQRGRPVQQVMGAGRQAAGERRGRWGGRWWGGAGGMQAGRQAPAVAPAAAFFRF